MPKIFAIIIAAGAALFLGNSLAHAKTGSERRKVTGKSGKTWFVATDPGQDPGSVSLTVYASATDQAPVLEYRQVIETGQRFVTFESPSTLSAAAKADFI